MAVECIRVHLSGDQGDAILLLDHVFTVDSLGIQIHIVFHKFIDSVLQLLIYLLLILGFEALLY